MVLVSDLQDKDVVSVAEQTCTISTTMHHKVGLLCVVEGAQQVNWSQSQTENYKEKIWQAWDETFHRSSKCSTSCCYDNLIIVDHGCTTVCLPLWGSGKIMCECEVVLFGKALHVWLWEKQPEFVVERLWRFHVVAKALSVMTHTVAPTQAAHNKVIMHSGFRISTANNLCGYL